MGLSQMICAPQVTNNNHVYKCTLIYRYYISNILKLIKELMRFYILINLSNT